MIATSFASRSRQGGSALAVPFTGSNLDLTAGTSGALSALSSTTAAEFYLGASESAQSSYLGTALANKQARFATVGAHQFQIKPNGASISNIDTDIQIYNPNAAPASVKNSRVCTDVNAQWLSGSITGAITSGGLIKDTNCSGTSQDAFFPGYDIPKWGPGVGFWSPMEGNLAIGPASFNYYGGYPYGLSPDQGGTPTSGGTSGGSYPYTSGNLNTGVLLTKAQILAATTWVAASPGAGQVSFGGTVVNGELITTNTPNGILMYQVVTAGTLSGTDNPTSGSWIDSTTNLWSSVGTTQTSPFTSGTAKLVLMAAALHSDGIQTVDCQNVACRFGFIADFASSCALVQNLGSNTNATPVSNWVFEDHVWRAGGNYFFYVQTQAQDAGFTYAETGLGGSQPSYWAGHNSAGGFTRNSSTDWVVAANPGLSRPRHAGFARNTLLTPTSGPQAGISEVTWGQALECNGSLIVSTAAVRIAGIAAQYRWDSGDQRIQMMEMGTYDYPTLGEPTPDSAVLEARLQALLTGVGNNQEVSATPGNCDARTWIKWELNNLNEAGAVITPSTSASIHYPTSVAGILDSRGNYIGG